MHGVSQHEVTTGLEDDAFDFDRLPAELRNKIYENSADEPYKRVLIEHGEAKHPLEHVSYESKAASWAPRGISRQAQREYESFLGGIVGKKPFTMYTYITRDHAVGMQITFFRDRLNCVPESRSTSSLETIYSMKTWCGTLMALAYEVLTARTTDSRSSLSLDYDYALDVRERAEERPFIGLVTEVHRCKNDIRKQDKDLDVCENLNHFVREAIVHLSTNPVIKLMLYIPLEDEISMKHLMSLIHDLRYLADNGLLRIYVDVECEEDISDWFPYVGGHVTWKFRTVQQRDGSEN